MNSEDLVNSLVGLLNEAYVGTSSSFFTDAEKGGLRWSLANLNAAAKGTPWNPDWSAS